MRCLVLKRHHEHLALVIDIQCHWSLSLLTWSKVAFAATDIGFKSQATNLWSISIVLDVGFIRSSGINNSQSWNTPAVNAYLKIVFMH